MRLKAGCLLLLIFFFIRLSGQIPYISANARRIITANCVLCAVRPGDSLRLIAGFDSFPEVSYHNCHAFFFRNQTDSCYKYALITLRALRENRDRPLAVVTRYLRSRVLIRKQLFNEALESCLDLLKTPGLARTLKCETYAFTGDAYLMLGEYRHALACYDHCLENPAWIDTFTLKDVYSNAALCHMFLSQPATAEAYHRKSIAISQQLNDTTGICSSYTNIASQYYDNYRDAAAVAYFRKAYDLAMRTGDLNLKQYACINMSIIHENTGRHRQALVYRKAYERLHDSVYNRDAVWNAAAIKNRLDSQEHAYSVQIMQQRYLIQGLQIAEQRRHLVFSVFVALTFLAFLAMTYFSYRQKSRQNRIIMAQHKRLDELNQTKDRLFSVVAHDLRSPVQTLKITLSSLRTALSERNIGRAETISTEIDALSNSTHSLLNNLLYWALAQTGQLHCAAETLNLKRLADQVFYDYSPVAAAKNIVLENLIPEDLYCSGDMNTVKILLRNLVDNAIKFSGPSTIVTVSGTLKGESCVMSVTDCGSGIDAAVVRALNGGDVRWERGPSQSTGIGLWLVKTMAERNGGSIQIERREKGTRMNVQLPLTHEETCYSPC